MRAGVRSRCRRHRRQCAAAKRDKSEDGLEQRRFAHAILAENSHDLARRDGERHRLHDRDRAIAARDPLEAQHLVERASDMAAAGIDGADGFRIDDLIHPAVQHETTLVQHHDARRDVADEIEVMFDQDNRETVLAVRCRRT